MAVVPLPMNGSSTSPGSCSAAQSQVGASAARVAVPPERLHPIPEQDSTDFDKCLRHIAAPLVLGVGFLGGRVDHELAAFSTLVTRCDRPALRLETDGGDRSQVPKGGSPVLGMAMSCKLWLPYDGCASGSLDLRAWCVRVCDGGRTW